MRACMRALCVLCACVLFECVRASERASEHACLLCACACMCADCSSSWVLLRAPMLPSCGAGHADFEREGTVSLRWLIPFNRSDDGYRGS